MDDTEEYVKKHDKLFNINGVYSRHSDIAKELVILSHLYSKNGFDLHESLGLVADEKSALAYLLGNSLEENRINQRPLAKLTQDIASKFDIL